MKGKKGGRESERGDREEDDYEVSLFILLSSLQGLATSGIFFILNFFFPLAGSLLM